MCVCVCVGEEGGIYFFWLSATKSVLAPAISVYARCTQVRGVTLGLNVSAWVYWNVNNVRAALVTMEYSCRGLLQVHLSQRTFLEILFLPVSISCSTFAV